MRVTDLLVACTVLRTETRRVTVTGATPEWWLVAGRGGVVLRFARATGMGEQGTPAAGWALAADDVRRLLGLVVNGPPAGAGEAERGTGGEPEGGDHG